MSTRTCPCTPGAIQPWRARDHPFSLASFLGGIVVLAFGAAAIAADKVPWVGYLVVGLIAVAFAVALVLQARRGHCGSCWLRRSAWYALATPGLPVRVLTSLA